MTNADKFRGIFGISPTELWAKPEKEFLKWLNEDVPETNVGDTISRQDAIDAILEMNTENRVSWLDCVLDTLDALPPAQHKITAEEVKDWLHKRCLVVIDVSLYKEMKRRCAGCVYEPIEGVL